MAWPLIALAAGAGLGAWGAGRSATMTNKKLKNAMSDYPYTPYSGDRPPEIDTDEKKILRPTQAQLFDILMARSKGEDVGYSPAWMSENTKLIESQLGRQEEDQLRASKGSLSAAGLSGNPRAYEATAGRVKRDTGRSLSDAMSQLAISDMERKNEERDVNTARLQDLNTFNFGQENIGAEFDLNKWKAEESAKQTRTGLGLDYAQMYRDPGSQALTSIGGSLTSIGGMGMMGGGGGGSPTMSSSASALGRTSGQGIAPTSSYALQTNPSVQGNYYKNRYLAR